MTRRPEAIDTVIWDFNGTLIDDLDLAVRSVNVQLSRRALPLLTIDRYREVFGFPVSDYYRRIGLDSDAEDMAELAAEFFDVYVPGVPACPLCDGAAELLEILENRSVRQFVLSAMETRMLRDALSTLGIAGRFVAAYGLDHQEGDSKTSRGHELLADFAIRAETALLIGDTDHDAEVADALAAQVALVACGHQSAERLRRTGCRVFEGLSDLAKWIRGAPQA